MTTESLWLEPFLNAHKDVWNKLTQKERAQLTGQNTLQHVWGVADEIQKKQAEKGTLGNMNKIRPYLEVLEGYGEVIGVFVQAKPEIIALVWVVFTCPLQWSLLTRR